MSASADDNLAYRYAVSEYSGPGSRCWKIDRRDPADVCVLESLYFRGRDLGGNQWAVYHQLDANLTRGAVFNGSAAEVFDYLRQHEEYQVKPFHP